MNKFTAGNWVGSVPMGNGFESLVDERFKYRGVKGLVVAGNIYRMLLFDYFLSLR